MHGPAVPAWLLVVLCAVSGSSCLLRLRDGPAADRAAAAGEALMAFGMAAMAVPAAAGGAGRAWLLGAVFGAATLHALWHTGRSAWAALPGSGHLAHHLVGSLAMLYMALVMAGGHGSAGVPLLTGLLLLYYAGYVLLAGVRLVPAAAGHGGPVAVGRTAGLVRACRLAMGMGMFAMLLTV
ncbi:DUF5134 domain-containing protein [Streptomyces bambusae]|uniref:DUF5134 domain-containing protein n=1 Tax=Streptomyces bambusae TaxID=1550616 RepID=UPI001CFF3A72|nr:DUF5134 domain-containing protein [Streptomyces bambusae]MCB5166684.1 DUF5134 domain-containing protein [Streptomyces bambusae]